MRQAFWTAAFAAIGMAALIPSAMAVPIFPVPEPASMSIIGLGIGALVVVRRLRRKD